MSILINDGKETDEDIMRCDIGEFVVIVEKLKRQLGPIIKVAKYGMSIYRWERPWLTILTIILCCSIFAVNPAYMFICVLLPIPPWLFVEYIRFCCKRVPPSKFYTDYVQQKGDEYQQFLKQAALERQRERLNMFLDILIGLQRIFTDMTHYFEYLHSVITWKRKKLSCLLLLGSLLVEFSFYLFDIHLVLCAVTLCLFFINRFFIIAVKRFVNSFVSYVNSFYSKSPKRMVNKQEQRKVPIEIELPEILEEEKMDDLHLRPAEDIYSSCTSESEEELDNKKDEIDMVDETQSRSQPASGFAMSMFIPRSIRRRYMGGNCSKCDQPASSILKKRRYCRHCGNSFCSRCCYIRVPRSFLGATAPAAYQEKVLVCDSCHVFLTNRMNTSPSELVVP